VALIELTLVKPSLLEPSGSERVEGIFESEVGTSDGVPYPWKIGEQH
jgi:hypothetical protein